MEQELFSTAQIAAELEHKSKNPRRDVLNIAKRLGLEPVETRPHTRNGKLAGGKPEMFWSREQRDAILADNRNRHKEPAQVVSPDVTSKQPDVVICTPSNASCNSKASTTRNGCAEVTSLRRQLWRQK